MRREQERMEAEETWVAALRSLLMQNRNIGPTQLVDLPIEILFIIMEKLPLPSFLYASRVCELFRLSFKPIMRSYLANLPPFIIGTRTYGNNKIYFYNIMNSEWYSTMALPNVINVLRGVSGGFLVFEDINRIWFSHPITGTTLEFYKPLSLSFISYSSIILVELFPDNDYLAVVLHKGMIGVNHIGNWSMYSLSWAGEAIEIIYIAASKDSVLALTHKGSIATMVYSNSSPSFKLLMMLKEKRFKENSKMVISIEEEIMVVEFDYSKKSFQIFRADMDLKEWVIVTNLGNQALFIEQTVVVLCDPRCWGGLPNHLYYLDSSQLCWSVSPLGDSANKSMKLVRQSVTFSTSTRISRSWYFPHLASSVTRIYNNLQPE